MGTDSLGQARSRIWKVLGMDMKAPHHDLGTSGGKAAAPFETYLEEEPTVGEWLRGHMPTRHDVVPYITSFFPFTSWIGRYNTRWLLADAIAGITLGLVVIPQAMAYAILAGLSPEYGLYTSFTGAALYWLFGTSKDVAIGATAVVSLLVGKTIDEVLAQQQHQPDRPPYTREQVAKTHAFLAGCVLLVFGLLRLDWLIEFIPHVAIAAFVTGAAINISLSQTPALLGLQAEVNSKDAAYRVFVDTCRALPRTRLDAAIGISGLVLLGLIKWYCDYMSRRNPRRERMWNMLSSLRLSLTILLFTLVSFLVHHNVPFEESKFRILGRLPKGFIRNGPPSFDPKLVLAVLPQMPPTVIILLIEHIAIGKSFGRLNEYIVVPSQELMSIAFTNLIGPFVGAYASTGSFSGTAILSKAGVRTPLAGVFNGLVLILALYALTSVLYYIPLASLSALIIHAVYNLITPPAELVRMWHIAPPDVVFYFVGVLVSVFDSLEDGIYVTVALALALLLLRIAKANGQFLGRVTVFPYPASPPTSQAEPGNVIASGGQVGTDFLAETDSTAGRERTPSLTTAVFPLAHQKSKYEEDNNVPRLPVARDIFFRLDHGEAINPEVAIATPHPGVFVFRLLNGLNYLNQAQLLDNLAGRIMRQTRRTTVIKYAHKGHRPWNEPSPPATPQGNTTQSDSPCSSSATSATSEQLHILPTLRAVVLDCATIHHTDSGAVEGLVDLRAQLDRWAAPDIVEWHFAGLRNRWTRRAFAAVGFGCHDKRGDSNTNTIRSGLSLVARYESKTGNDGAGMESAGRNRNSRDEEETCGSETEVATGDGEEVFGNKEQPSDITTRRLPDGQRRLAPVTGMDRPYFHVDLAVAASTATRRAVQGTKAVVL